jgi:hypothetical protein
MKGKDWEAFRPWLRQLLFAVTKPIEEKNGVLVIAAPQRWYCHSNRFDFDVSRCLAIVEEIAKELRDTRLKRVEFAGSIKA